MTISKFYIFSATVPVVLATVAYYLMCQDLLGGVVELRGPSYYEDIDIYQADLGYKVVEAKTYMGALYGLGFVHARDRLW